MMFDVLSGIIVMAEAGTVADSEPREVPELPIKYLGNSFSSKFHRPSCPFAKAMNSRHVQFFNYRWQAVQAGEVPCRYCLPPDWKTTHCVMLPRDSAVASGNEVELRAPPAKLLEVPPSGLSESAPVTPSKDESATK